MLRFCRSIGLRRNQQNKQRAYVYSQEEVTELSSRWSPALLERIRAVLRKREHLLELLARLPALQHAPNSTRNIDLRFIDLKMTNLAHWQFPDGDLYGASFQGANLQGANLRASDLRRTSFFDANLHSSSLKSARMDYANLERANLRQANLQGVNLQGAVLDDANLDGARMLLVNLRGASLWGANMRGTHLWGCDIKDVAGLSANVQVSATAGNRAFLEIEIADDVSPEDLSRLLFALNRIHNNVCGQPLEVTRMQVGLSKQLYDNALSPEGE